MHAPPLPLLTRPTRTRHVVLALLCLLSLITYLDRICIMRARTDIQSALHVPDALMGLVFSAFTLGYTLFEVPAGWMGDRWGARRVLTRIVLVWSLFTALTGSVWPFSLEVGPLVFNSIALLILIRFLFGAGEAGAYPNITRIVGDWFPARERGLAQGSIWTAARLGGAFAPLILGSLSRAIGWRGAFWVLGLIGVGWVALFLWWFRDRPDDHPACNDAERELIRGPRRTAEVATPAEAVRTDLPSQAVQADLPPPVPPVPAPGDGHAWPGFGPLVTNLSIWGLGWAAFWICMAWYFLPTWQPKYLEERFGYNPTGLELEVLTGLPFLFGAAGCLAGGRLSDWLVHRVVGQRWGRALIGLIGFAAAGLFIIGSAYAVTPLMAVLLLCMASFSNDMGVPVMWATSAEVGDRYAGSVSGLMNTAGGVGAIICPILIPVVLGWLPDGYSAAERWRLIFLGLAASWFLAAVAWLFIDARESVRGLGVRG